MPVVPAPWREYTWDGVEGYLWDSKLFISKDYNPETGVAMAFFAPPGGRAAVPAMVQGDPGIPFTPGESILDGELEWDDPAEPTSSWVLKTPGTNLVAAVYDYHYTQRKGAPGNPSELDFLDATDLVGTPAAGYYPAWVADTGTALGSPASGQAGAIWTPPPLGARRVAVSPPSTDNSNGVVRTLTYVTMPVSPVKTRLTCQGQSVITGTGANVRVDLMARVNNGTNEGNGDVIARTFGQIGAAPQTLRLLDTADFTIPAGAGPTTVYLRAERQAGADSFTTQGATTTFVVDQTPAP